MKIRGFHTIAVGAGLIVCIGLFVSSPGRAADSFTRTINEQTQNALVQIRSEQIRDFHRGLALQVAAGTPQAPAGEARKVAANLPPRPHGLAGLDMLRPIAENAALHWLPEMSLRSLLRNYSVHQ